MLNFFGGGFSQLPFDVILHDQKNYKITVMKFLNYMTAAMLAAMTTVGFTACSSDDDDISLETPQYESSAAKYEITSSDSPYSSIELTSSGNYIITEADYASASYATRSASEMVKSHSIFKNETPRSRSEFGGYKYGTYTKTGDNQYNLSGFGTITIEQKDGNNYDLDIELSDGQTMTLGANRENMYSSSKMTDYLCRTWEITKWVDKEWENGKLITDETSVPGQEQDDPLEAVFTKAGSYVVTYKDGTLDISTWKWDNEDKGILRYSWNLDNINDPEESGTVTVTFNGNTCEVYEEETYEEGDVTYKSTCITYLEAK